MGHLSWPLRKNRIGRRAWHPAVIVQNQTNQLSRLPVARDEPGRLMEAGEKPAEEKLVCPGGYRGLLATEESDRRAGAMDRRGIIEFPQEIRPELLLDAPSDRHHHV